MLERMILRRMMRLFEENHILADQMTAYRPLKGPQENLLDLCSDVEEAITEKGHVLAVFFDVSGAYDKLRYETIVDLLNTIGLSPQCGFYKAILTHLSGRSLRLKCGEHKTRMFNIPNQGVSQGAVLSPILFAACSARLRKHLPKGFQLSLIF